jgi:hypothetical protein
MLAASWARPVTRSCVAGQRRSHCPCQFFPPLPVSFASSVLPFQLNILLSARREARVSYPKSPCVNRQHTNPKRQRGASLTLRVGVAESRTVI